MEPQMSNPAEEWKWKVESASGTLRDAAKVKRNKKLYDAAIAELKKQRNEITKVISNK